MNDVDISFNNAGAVLNGVKEYVPAPQHYIVRYQIDRYQTPLIFFHNLNPILFDASVVNKECLQRYECWAENQDR